MSSPSDIGYAYGCGVVAPAVGSEAFDGASLMDGAVKVYHIMIAYRVETSGFVPAVYLSDRDMPSARCGGAVDDETVDGAHKSVW